MAVKFELLNDSYRVDVNNLTFGYITKRGFTAGFPRENWPYVGPNDFREIAKKIDEVFSHGFEPPICLICKGTPFFPNEIETADNEKVICKDPFHPSSIP